MGGTVRMGPLRNLPVLKDLVVDPEPFFVRYRRVDPAGGALRSEAPAGLGNLGGLHHLRGVPVGLHDGRRQRGLRGPPRHCSERSGSWRRRMKPRLRPACAGWRPPTACTDAGATSTVWLPAPRTSPAAGHSQAEEDGGAQGAGVRNPPMNELTTDVAIIGSGGAGLFAALRAATHPAGPGSDRSS